MSTAECLLRSGRQVYWHHPDPTLRHLTDRTTHPAQGGSVLRPQPARPPRDHHFPESPVAPCRRRPPAAAGTPVHAAIGVLAGRDAGSGPSPSDQRPTCAAAAVAEDTGGSRPPCPAATSLAADTRSGCSQGSHSFWCGLGRSHETRVSMRLDEPMGVVLDQSLRAVALAAVY